MPLTAVAIDCLQPLQIALDFAAKITLDFELVVADCVNDFVDLLGAEIFRARVRVDICLLENATGSGETNPVNIGQRRFDALVRWNFNSE